MPGVTAVPVVDLRADPARLRDGLREAAHRVGFFYLTGHGVAPELVTRMLEAARRLFALPQHDKDSVAMVRSPHFRGYTRLGGEVTRGEVDWREQIDIGPQRPPIGGLGKSDYRWLQGPNQWPAALPELPGLVEEWDAALSAVARTLLRHWAASLGSPADVFDPAFAETPATLIKIIRYPGRAAGSQGVGAHRDAGVLTLLLAEPGSRGLQVRRAFDGAWIDVPRARGRSSSTSVNCWRRRRAATCGPPSTGSTCRARRPTGSRCPTSSIRASTRGYPCSRCLANSRRAPGRTGRRRRIPPTPSSRSTAATPGRAGCARTRMSLPRMGIGQSA
ncbi:non-heme dioxygenase in morphine synthesis family protein [Mycobacterium intracellulare 1956]|uniref:Non-heme dioxygenase in morphine synthesis family protein n=1 Tax=Mycobacterium intracellulare 1956 TaxID=1299331 RepID=X8CC44_MYCIT|nr:non-heme dioxygenase in morphine synthesis family protein [Mycobacterium intracellulare 1956]